MENVVRGGTGSNYAQLYIDIERAYQLGLLYNLGAGDAYGEAAEYYLNGKGMGSLYNAMPFIYDNGLVQWQEAGRDQGHTTLGISLCGAINEMAWSQEFDFYGLSDNRFLKAAEYVARYNNTEQEEETDEDRPKDGADIKEGKYVIQSVLSGLYLEVADGKAANGTNVQMGSADSVENHNTWLLKSVGGGYYQLYSCISDGQYMLDLDYGRTANGTNIQIYGNTYPDAQLFKFVPAGSGQYTITTKVTNDKSALDIYDHNTSVGANVCQWECTGNPNQCWKLIEIVDDSSSTVDPVVVAPEMLSFSFTLGGQIGVNCDYEIADEYVNGNYTVKAVFTNGDETITVDLDKSQTTTVSGTTAYRFTLPVASCNMTELYTAVVVVTDANGNEVVRSDEDSVSVNKCMRSLTNSGGDLGKALANALRTGTNENDINLAKALYKYGVAATDYIG